MTFFLWATLNIFLKKNKVLLNTCFAAYFRTQIKLAFFAIQTRANDAAFQQVLCIVKQRLADMAAVAYIFCTRNADRPMIRC
jgi:hypothetical protein